MRDRGDLGKDVASGATEPARSGDSGEPGALARGLLMRKLQRRLQRRAAAESDGVESGADAKVSRAGADSGAPLPEATRTKFESSLGADLSGVRVHTGSSSAQAADAVSARAYTTGSDIHFNQGEYQPGSRAGEHLLAHEVAHTVQQSSHGGAVTQHKLEVGSSEDPAEHEADRMADAIVEGRPAGAPAVGAGSVQRKKKRDAKTRPADVMVKDTAAEKSGTLANAYGTFNYVITKNAKASGCSFDLSFKAFSPEVDAGKITFIQTVQGHQAGGSIFYINNDSTYYAPFDAGPDGKYTDHLPGETDPFYNYDDGASADESTGTTGATGSTMHDAPQINSIGGERGHDFETAAFALSGGDKGEFYGTLTWGWKIDAAGTFSLNAVSVHDDITTGFGASLRKFIARQNQLTTTAATPAPVTMEMPLDACRELTAAENAKLKTVSDYAKAHANARIWVVARYDAQGTFGLEANHNMAKDNLRTVQQSLVAGGTSESTVRTTALEETKSAKAGVSPIEVTVVNS